jgi:hypothetical protein
MGMHTKQQLLRTRLSLARAAALSISSLFCDERRLQCIYKTALPLRQPLLAATNDIRKHPWRICA